MATVDRVVAAEPSTAWFPPLDEVAFDDSVKDGVVVVALKTELNEVPACL